MACNLNYEIGLEGVIFKCTESARDIPVGDWGRKEVIISSGISARLGPLNLLLEEETAKEDNSGFSVHIPHAALAKLENWELLGLDLPSMAPFRLLIQTHGTLTSDRFKVDYGFSHFDSLPVYGAERQGSFITAAGKQYLLLEPLYSVVELLDQYTKSPISAMDQRFLWWAKVKELLPEDTEINNFLKNINIVRPEHFTVDIGLKNGEIIITPRFIMPRDGSLDETCEAQEDEPLSLIPPVVHEDFLSYFKQHSVAKMRYALSGNWFVVVPESLKIAIQTVRTLQDEPTEKKMAFLKNPKSFIREKLEGLLEEGLIENIFLETPLFLNNRIKYLGVWQPKAGLFFKVETGQWLPEDGRPTSISLPLDGGLYPIDTDDLPTLQTEMENASRDGATSIQFRGAKYPVNQRSITAVQNAAKAIQGFRQPDKIPKNGETETAKNQAENNLAPIIYDHIEELGIYVDKDTKKRLTVHEAMPQLATGIHLHSHQEQGLAWLQANWRNASSGVLLADDMGLGKTLQALVFMRWVRLQIEYGCIPQRPMLLVAPTGLLRNWENEAKKFLPDEGLGTVFKAHGAGFNTTLQRNAGGAPECLKTAGWVLTTYETLRDKILLFIGVPWAIVVFDEVQKIKNPKSMVTDMAKSIKSEFALALTGTPVENTLVDLWCILDAVHPGILGTLKEFASKYMPNGTPEKENLKQLKKEISSPEDTPLMLRRTKEEHWKERPEKRIELHKLEMPPDQALAYAAAVHRAKNSSKKRGAMLEAIHNLRLISLHPNVYEDPSDDLKFINTSARLKTLFFLLNKIAETGEKVLIFVEYLRMQKILSALIQRKYHCQRIMLINGTVRGAKRQERVDTFQQNGDGFDAIILSPKAGGVGINLTAATHVIHLSRWWNPAVEDQCTDRAYRIGQKKMVTVHYPLAIHPDYGIEHSFDMMLHELLEKKRFLSRSLLAPPAGTTADVSWLFKRSVEEGEHNLPLKFEKNEQKKGNGVHPTDLKAIDLMEPLEFEEWVLSRYAIQGYKVLQTPVTGDAGADGIAISPDSSKSASYIIQCKHTQRKSPIGNSAVEEVLTACNRYTEPGVEFMPIVVTNASEFTKGAKTLARARNVTLISRNSLERIG